MASIDTGTDISADADLSKSAKSSIRLGFFALLFGTLDGYLCVATTDPRSPKTTFEQRFFKWPEQAIITEEWILKNENKSNMYFGVSLFSEPERKKAKAIANNLLWADLDNVNPSSLEEGKLPPPIVVRSSPGRWQGYWRTSVPLEPYQAEDYSRRIAYQIEADKTGWDLVQLMRIPFTVNYKYRLPVMVELERCLEHTAKPLIFEAIPAHIGSRDIVNETALNQREPEAPHTADEVIYKYSQLLQRTPFYTLYTNDRENEDSDWSSAFWALMHTCFRVGMSPEEVFSIVRDAACNKYARDGRPISHVWRDVIKAAEEYKHVTEISTSLITMPRLVEEPHSETFVDIYRKWAIDATDAVPDFHDLAIFVVLSAIVSSSVKIETSAGSLTPNLWGLILGESTLTRKAQPLDAKILTLSGWKLMGDIQIGDQVVGKDGEPTTVVGISPRTIDDCYEVVFSDGAKTQCSLDHLWDIKGRGTKSDWKTWDLGKIITQGYGKANHRQIPMVDPIILPEVDLPIDPYVFGCLLGDGSFQPKGSIRFSSKDQEIIDSVEEECNRFGIKLKKISGENCDYQLTAGKTYGHGFQGVHNQISNIIRDLDLEACRSHEKFVPDIYLNGSIQQRLGLLQGLMDTDGWISRGAASMQSSSPQLAEAVQYLVRSLGGWASITVRPFGTFKTRHQVHISMPMFINPFRLQRKAEKYNNRSWCRPRRFEDVNYVGKKEMQCIKVSAADGLYVTDDFIVTHNTTAMRLAMDFLTSIDAELVVATDGTAEGILSALALRPNRSSIYFKDEVSGLFDSMTKKDYLAGLQETLTSLYDSPSVYTRRLRKETIVIESPAFVFIGGGVTDRVYSAVDESFVLSGFLPRFLVVYGDASPETRRPLGPPSDQGRAERPKILSKLASLYELYGSEVEMKIGGQKVRMPGRVTARLSPGAWAKNAEFERVLLDAGANSLLSDLALPTFDRMSRSLLKMATVLGAIRQEPVDVPELPGLSELPGVTSATGKEIIIEEQDLINAAWFIQRWGQNSIDLIVNAGKGKHEKLIDKIYEFVRVHPGIVRGEILKRFHLNSREGQLVLETMEERAIVKKEQRGRGWSYWAVQ